MGVKIGAVLCSYWAGLQSLSGRTRMRNSRTKRLCIILFFSSGCVFLPYIVIALRGVEMDKFPSPMMVDLGSDALLAEGAMLSDCVIGGTGSQVTKKVENKEAEAASASPKPRTQPACDFCDDKPVWQDDPIEFVGKDMSCHSMLHFSYLRKKRKEYAITELCGQAGLIPHGARSVVLLSTSPIT